MRLPCEGVLAICLVTGETRRPPSPVHLRAIRQANGDIAIAWVRRSRAGWAWTSGADTPLGEEHERYLVRLASGGASRLAETEVAAFTYPAADQAADDMALPITIEVVQLGSNAASRPARIDFNGP